ncbi:glycosyl hydrolase family 26 [Paenibacillus taihuensis]|uniref:Glycosyl hydrolase family 26 n=1 Tax=Paenibacillus taihuensis TaxID=1156355 RepID=A0A3D9QTR6_9BACL|nr:glycosyl hydrolase [Paenibacillus taihuensis]REE66958.1 glycosyl hydrolase family 26 [Paenibacillus taihuensis]
METNRRIPTFARKLILAMFAIIVAFTTFHTYEANAATKWANYNDALALEKKGKYAEAIAKYKLVIPEFEKAKEYSNVATVYRNIGSDYSKLKQYDDAVAAWDKEAEYAAKVNQTQISLAAKRKADMMRSSAKLFVETTASEVGTSYTHGAKFEPKNGAYIGAYAELDPAVHNPANSKPFYTEQFPVMTGKKHAAYLLYFKYGQPLSTLKTHLDRARTAGTAIELGLQPMKGLGEVQDDEYLHQLARDIEASGVKVFLRFANEMNGDWVPWHEETPKNYIEKFKLVAKVFHQEAPTSVAMVWSPDRQPEYSIESYYPGDEAVDWVGVSLYSIFNPELDPLKQGEDRSSHLEKFDFIYKKYADRKPVFISEGGVAYMYPEKQQDKTSWAVYKINEFYSTLPMLYPKVKAVFWFDSNHDQTELSTRMKYYMLSANEKLLDVYKKSVANPFYLSSIGDESPVAYKPVNTASAVTATTQKISAYMKTWSPTLSKVTYEIGGKLIAAVTTAPWTANIDFAPYKGKKIDVVLKAYSGTALITTQKVAVSVK